MIIIVELSFISENNIYKLCWFIPLIDFIQSYPTLDEIVKKVNSTNQPYPLSSSLEIISLSFEIKNTDCFPSLSLSLPSSHREFQLKVKQFQSESN